MGLKPRASSTALLQDVGNAVKFVWALATVEDPRFETIDPT
jgi:hypothetical protein